MMRLGYHALVTGGPPPGGLTVCRAAVSPAGVAGLHEHAPGRVAAPGCALCSGLPSPEGAGAEGWAAADGAPGARGPSRPPAAPGRAALVEPGLPANGGAPGRAAVARA